MRDFPPTTPQTASAGIAPSAAVRTEAYDPIAQPELFEGVLARRFVAFLIDLGIIALPLVVMSLIIFVIGLLTLGLGWALFWFVNPTAVIWALVYYGTTLGGRASATLGMRAMGIEMRTWYGAPSYFALGAVHAIVYWITVSVLTPFILVVGFFNIRRRLLHDMIVGTVVINTAARATARRARMAGYA